MIVYHIYHTTTHIWEGSFFSLKHNAVKWLKKVSWQGSIAQDGFNIGFARTLGYRRILVTNRNFGASKIAITWKTTG